MAPRALPIGYFLDPPLSGAWAIFAGLMALAIPTEILLLNHSLGGGACCTTYVPFVLISAIMMGPGYASAVALGSAGLADALFMGTRYRLLESPMDRVGDLASLTAFALIIGLVYVARKTIAKRARLYHDAEARSGVIFSLEQGQAWASWPGAVRVRLGPQDEVADMMKDYLAQLELGDRLAQRCKRISSDAALQK